MRDIERMEIVGKFVADWSGKGYEKGETQRFWIRFLSDILGIENPTEYITFEDKVMLKHMSFMDAYIPATKVLIEQKSMGKDLRKNIKQSDGSSLSPFQQAKRYSAELPYSQRPRWIITSNFQEFLIYDMEQPQGDGVLIALADLEKEYYRFQFMKDQTNELLQKEMEVSMKAGEIVGVLYGALIQEYKDPSNPKTLESLNMFCVRIVFCLYAEDSGIFGEHGKFHDYIKSFAVKDVREALIKLFRILDQKTEERDPYEDDMLLSFPYVNGGLFADKDIEIPRMNETIVDLILKNASEDFDWSEISPTIFGAVFESTLNPETRHAGGMHYTSLENIHKVIDPLFLEDLKRELERIQAIPQEKKRNAQAEEFREKLSKLTFLDPACGSGNFLTETYISLRRLENEALKTKLGNQLLFGDDASYNPILVSIGQFYGIEINDFAVTVARTALWIAESQMMQETEAIVHMHLEFLPLRSYAHIIRENALTYHWQDLILPTNLSYIMGNPPFLGKRLQSKEQKADLVNCFEPKAKGVANLDFVCGWYKKAGAYIEGTKVEVAFVSTNSITQGEQVAILWNQLLQHDIKINFAYRTFKWTSEASEKAFVFCIIMGFSTFHRAEKQLFVGDRVQQVEQINGYLVDADFVLVENRSKPLCDVSKMVYGSKPTDGGYLSNYTEEAMQEMIQKYPKSAEFFKPLLGGEEFIHNKKRYCLWLHEVSPAKYSKIPPIMEAIRQVKEMRLDSIDQATRKAANTPFEFQAIRQPDTDYLLVPEVSSENRKYIPIGFISKNIISNNRNQVIPNATLYEFGVLTSNVHMSWARAVCGRYGPSLNYSATIVYNNFPWCNPSEKQKQKIEQTAQAILDARAKYPECSMAELYHELTMPKELRSAHQQNDKAVMTAYGFPTKMSEAECVAELMKLYQNLITIELKGKNVGNGKGKK